MSPRSATLFRLSAAGALAGLAACKAVDLAPQTEAARAANAEARGYPRLVDVPPEPADVACVRGALAGSLIAVVQEDPEPASPFADEVSDPFDAAAGMPDVAYRATLARSVQTQGPYRSVWSSFQSLAGAALGSGEESPANAGPTYIDCPPGPVAEAERLAAARQELERAAAAIRAQRPVSGDISIELPADMPGRPVPEASQ